MGYGILVFALVYTVVSLSDSTFALELPGNTPAGLGILAGGIVTAVYYLTKSKK